jgi:hypothetical protein
LQNKNLILKNKEADEQLLNDGYAIIPFLTIDEIKDLIDFFYQSHTDINEGLTATAHNPDINFRQKINQKITSVFERASTENFINIQPLGGTFMVKTKGESGKLYPHQDWNIVDEDLFRSFNVWVPLVDVSAANGSIQILPGSHLWHKTFRGINIPPAYASANDIVWKKMETIKMKAGEALIYDHRLIHASEVNCSETHRLVIVYGIIPKEAEMRYYFMNENRVEEYACYSDFFLKGNPAAGPAGLKKLREIEYKLPDIENLFSIETNIISTESISLFNKIKQLLFN